MKRAAFLIAISLIGNSFGFSISWKVGGCIVFPHHCLVIYEKDPGVNITSNVVRNIIDDLQGEDKMACGNKGLRISEGFLTKVYIPDEFPPDETALNLLTNAFVPGASAIQACAAFGVVNLAPACREHDTCRELRGRTGINSATCDLNMKAQWQKACEFYKDKSSACMALCKETVEGSWDIMMAKLKAFDGARSVEGINYYINR